MAAVRLDTTSSQTMLSVAKLLAAASKAVQANLDRAQTKAAFDGAPPRRLGTPSDGSSPR